MAPWRGMGEAMAWGWVFGLLVLIGVVVLVVVLVRVLGSGTSSTPPRPPGQQPPVGPPPAEAILAERYARGEISTDEYLERLRTLRGG